MNVRTFVIVVPVRKFLWVMLSQSQGHKKSCFDRKDAHSDRIAEVKGPLFTKRTDALPQDLVKSRSREIRV